MAKGKGSSDAAKIGTKGPVKGSTISSKGAQFSFLPGSESVDNAGVSRRTVSSGTPATSSKGAQHSFLPKSYDK